MTVIGLAQMLPVLLGLDRAGLLGTANIVRSRSARLAHGCSRDRASIRVL
jgi:hypothetical protein